MSARLLRAAALLAAALSLNHSGAAAQEGEVPHFEIDIIFPRNETYTTSDVFPIAFAIQNLTAVRSLGNFTFWWDIMPWSYGRIPSGMTNDAGQFNLDDLDDLGDEGETYIAVANSNVSDWIHHKDRGDRFAMQWALWWGDMRERCEPYDTSVGGRLLFSIEAPWESESNERFNRSSWDAAGLGIPPVVTAGTECPALGSVVEIKPNVEAPLCPIVEDDNTGREGNPCAVKVDEAVASSIASRASSLATPPPTATPSSDSDAGGAEDDENVAPDGSPPVLTALVAACVLGCFAVS